ncbi:unnamed protein product [Blepharisma stoltei]|uniref:Uncharacterized protein n=1 Tax=Blepharisma stoltei TaxID=1481888 RepID=A0AAU9JD06_9CILI|nr:unnamed protein product [Blepharisma stoltei]
MDSLFSRVRISESQPPMMNCWSNINWEAPSPSLDIGAHINPWSAFENNFLSPKPVSQSYTDLQTQLQLHPQAMQTLQQLERQIEEEKTQRILLEHRLVELDGKVTNQQVTMDEALSQHWNALLDSYNSLADWVLTRFIEFETSLKQAVESAFGIRSSKFANAFIASLEAVQDLEALIQSPEQSQIPARQFSDHIPVQQPLFDPSLEDRLAHQIATKADIGQIFQLEESVRRLVFMQQGLVAELKEEKSAIRKLEEDMESTKPDLILALELKCREYQQEVARLQQGFRGLEKKLKKMKEKRKNKEKLHDEILKKNLMDIMTQGKKIIDLERQQHDLHYKKVLKYFKNVNSLAENMPQDKKAAKLTWSGFDELIDADLRKFKKDTYEQIIRQTEELKAELIQNVEKTLEDTIKTNVQKLRKKLKGSLGNDLLNLQDRIATLKAVAGLMREADIAKVGAEKEIEERSNKCERYLEEMMESLTRKNEKLIQDALQNIEGSENLQLGIIQTMNSFVKLIQSLQDLLKHGSSSSSSNQIEDHSPEEELLWRKRLKQITLRQFRKRVWGAYRIYPTWARKGLESLCQIELYDPMNKDKDRDKKLLDDDLYKDFISMREKGQNRYSEFYSGKTVEIPLHEDRSDPETLEFALSLIVNFPILERVTGETIRSAMKNLGLLVEFTSNFPMRISYIAYARNKEDSFTRELLRRLSLEGVRIQEKRSRAYSGDRRVWTIQNRPNIEDAGKIFLIDGSVLNLATEEGIQEVANKQPNKELETSAYMVSQRALL